MAEAIACLCVKKLGDYAIAAIFSQFEYLFRYNRNIQNLRDKVRDLKHKRDDVEDSVDEAKRNALVIKSEVDAWLKKVDDLKKEADEVLNSSTNSEMRCLCLGCPNLMTRCLLSKNATKKITAIDELLKVKFEEVGKRPPPKILTSHGSERLKTRISTKEKIIKALEDTHISKVGICGLPGVGKTTMAKEVMTQVLKDKLFDEVAMVVVSKGAEIKIIQEKLAEVLNLKIEEKTDKDVRASRLNERLTYDKKKRILVILDDVWTDIDLKNLGIDPSLNHGEGLKILLTSRFEHVCEGMGALTNIKVEGLDSNEAFDFLQEISKISNDDTQLLAIAKQVAEECKGLPLALEVVGKTLINRKLHAWEDALNQLQNSQLDEKVYSSIELSYNYLKSDEHRSLLLLCSIFPEDESIPIEILVRYARGLELFKNTKTLLQTRNRAHTISDNLKSCHLLLPGSTEEGEEEVKLHDVIRDFCLSIASKGERWYMVKHDFVTEWPEPNVYESYSAISLTFQEAIRLPSRLRCGNLKLLRMQFPRWRASKLDIPKIFLDDTQELIVIDIFRLRIPSPIQLSNGLRTLCLDGCVLAIGMSFFGSLKNLEILTLFESSLSVHFPSDEVVELSNLKLLDLRFERGPCPLPPGFLLGMKKLEELCLGHYYKFYIENEEKEHIIQEVSSLKALNSLQIDTDDTQFLMQLLQGCSEKLKTFQIIQDSYNPGHCRRYLSLENVDPNMLSEPGIKSLMRKSEKLSLSVKGWNNPVIELAEDGFINLKSLELKLLDSEYIIDAAGSIPSDTFRMESLRLVKMSRLKEMCNANFPRMEYVTRGVSEPALFRNLKEIEVEDCAKIKRMFSESVAKCMVNLQNLIMSICPLLEEVVSVDTQENEIIELPLFPKLKRVELYNLESFVSFGSQPNAAGLRQTLLNQVTLPNMEKLTTCGLDKMKRMFSESVAKCMVNLEELNIQSCPSLEVVSVDTQENEITEPLSFPKLKVVELRDLKSFVSFRSQPNVVGLRQTLLNQVTLPNMERLTLYCSDSIEKILSMEETPSGSLNRLMVMKVEFCDNLVNIAQSNSIKLLKNLETLEVVGCRALNVIFDFEGLNVNKDNEEEISILGQLKSLNLDNGDYLVHITRMVPKGIRVFQNLKELKVENCGRLRYLFPASMINSFVCLEILSVRFCGEIEEIFGGEEEEGMASKFEFHELRSIQLLVLPRFKMFCSHNYELAFPSLDLLKIVDCPVMTKFCSGQLNAPKLKGVRIENGEIIDISNFLP